MEIEENEEKKRDKLLSQFVAGGREKDTDPIYHSNTHENTTIEIYEPINFGKSTRWKARESHYHIKYSHLLFCPI